MLNLHKKLSIILRIFSCTRKIDVEKFKQYCKEKMTNTSKNFPWALLNHTLHGTIQHNAEVIEINGEERIGWYSEEGLESNNKDIRKYLECLSRKYDSNYQIEDVHHRLVERSDPYLIHITSKYTGRKLCTVSKSTEHTHYALTMCVSLQSMVLRSSLYDFNFRHKYRFLPSCFLHDT